MAEKFDNEEEEKSSLKISNSKESQLINESDKSRVKGRQIVISEPNTLLERKRSRIEDDEENEKDMENQKETNKKRNEVFFDLFSISFHFILVVNKQKKHSFRLFT